MNRRDIFAANGDVIIMFLPYETLVNLPYRDPPESFKTELSGATLVDSVAGRTAPPGHAFCKIMAGTTNEQFRKWCFDHKKHCLPLNVIMVEVCVADDSSTFFPLIASCRSLSAGPTLPSATARAWAQRPFLTWS